MSISYFLSDVHLGFGSPETESKKLSLLLSLLEEIETNAEHFIIVGDLFDFWYEYASVIPKGYHRLLTALENIRRKNISIDYIVGYHDFAVGDYFEKDLGINVWKHDFSTIISGKNFYCYHGDGLAHNDGGYRMLKKVLRNPVSQTLFRWIHPDLGFKLAHHTSRTSRDYTSKKEYGEQDGMRIEAEKKMRDGFDYVIMGHRHQPCIEQIANGTYINLGDWIRHYTYGVFDGEKFELRSARHTQQEIIAT